MIKTSLPNVPLSLGQFGFYMLDSQLMCIGTLLGGMTLSVSLLPPFSVGSTLKGKNLLLREQILSFKSRLQFGRDLSYKKSNRKLQSFSLLK